MFAFVLIAFLGQLIKCDGLKEYPKKTKRKSSFKEARFEVFNDDDDNSSNNNNNNNNNVYREVVVGGIGAHYQFDGVDDYIVAKDVRGLPERTISVCAWVYLNKHKSFNRIASHEWINWGWNLYSDAQGVARFGIGRENKDFSAGKVLFLNRWQFVCGTYDARAITVYVDGSAGPEVPLSGSVIDNDGHVTIGGAEWDPFDGKLDDVSIWTHALSPAEVRRLMVEALPKEGNMFLLSDPSSIWMLKNCVAFWSFDEGKKIMLGDTSQGGGNEETLLPDMSGRQNSALLGRGNRQPRRLATEAPPSRIPCVGRKNTNDASGVSDTRSPDKRQSSMREKIDLNVDFKENGAKATIVFRVTSIYPQNSVKLSLRFGFDKYAEEGENIEIGRAYEIDPTLDPQDLQNLSKLARSLFVEAAELDLEWETDDAFEMECTIITIETKVVEKTADGLNNTLGNVEDIPWSPHIKSVFVDVAEQPEICKAFDGLINSRVGPGSCTEQRKEVRQIRPKKEYAEFVAKMELERKEIVSAYIEDGSIGAMPLVSVIVPFYNGAKETLEETIQSVFSQTYSNIEILLIDDGSQDGSRDYAKKLVEIFEKRGGRPIQIAVHEKKNGGLGHARNFGFDRARGKYVLPLDADDLIDETYIEKAIILLEDPNTDYNLAVADLVGFGDWEYSWSLPKFDAQDLRYFNAFHCSAVILKSLWENTPGGYPRTTLFGYEDWAFWLEAEKYVGLKPVNIREPLFKYRLRKGSMLQSMIEGKNELFALASVRMLNPITYPIELIFAAHDMFNTEDVNREIIDTLTSKLTKFHTAIMPHLMLGIYFESSGKYPEARQMFLRAAELSDGTNDWQARWRDGLLLQKVGNYKAGNDTLLRLFDDFDGLEQEYEAKRQKDPRKFGKVARKKKVTASSKENENNVDNNMSNKNVKNEL
jgi:glycosyltransferase involved in cell wall biosynthesis